MNEITISRQELDDFVGLRGFGCKGRRFLEIPQLICADCGAMLGIMLKHNPEEVEISGCPCK